MKTFPVLMVLVLASAAPLAGASGVLRPAAEQVDAACTYQGSVLWLISAPNTVEACGNLYGYVGYASIKPCQPPGPAIIGYPRLVMQTLHDAVKDDAPCKPTVRDQVNATIAIEEAAWGVALPLLDGACAASGGGDPREGLCGALYGNPGYGAARPCAVAPTLPGCSPSARQLIDAVLA